MLSRAKTSHSPFDRGVVLEDAVHATQLEYFVHGWPHGRQPQIATMLAGVLDRAKQCAQTGTAGVFQVGEVGDEMSLPRGRLAAKKLAELRRAHRIHAT